MTSEYGKIAYKFSMGGKPWNDLTQGDIRLLEVFGNLGIQWQDTNADPTPLGKKLLEAAQIIERAALERAAEICDEAWKFEQDAGIAANAIRALIEQGNKETK